MTRIIGLSCAFLLATAQIAQATQVTLNVPVQVANWAPNQDLALGVGCYVLSVALSSVAQYHSLSGSPAVGATGSAPVIGKGLKWLTMMNVENRANGTITIPVNVAPQDAGNIRSFYCFFQSGDPRQTFNDVPHAAGAPYTPEVVGNIATNPMKAMR